MQEKKVYGSTALPDQVVRRRIIHVGERVVTGVVCPACPPWTETVIFPESGLEAHMTRGHGVMESGQKKFARYHHAGRPRGSKSRTAMSSTGVTYKRGIRGAR
jgi:hypothetical protein